MTRLKHVLRLQYGSALAAESRQPGDIPVYGSNGPVGSHNKSNMRSPAVVVGRKGSHGKIVWAERGGFCIDTALFVDRRFTSLCLRYAFYLLQTLGLDKPSKDSAVPGLDRFEAHNKEIPSLLTANQEAIAHFLDRETSRIDQLIEKKQRLVALWSERSTAILELTVKGQNQGKIPIRDSGIEWIGAIPEHWTTPKINQVAVLATGHTPSRSEESLWIPEECTIPWFGLQDIWQVRREGRLYVSTTKERISPRGLANSAAELLPANTVILSRTASVGFPAIMEVPMATTQDFVNWVCGPKLRPKYLYYVLRAMRRELNRLKIGSTHQTIYMPDVRAFRMPLPPVPEQDEIIHSLDTSLAAQRNFTAAVDASLERLRELRSTLITAAVTGQIDVATRGKRGETDRRLDAMEHELEAERDGVPG